MYIENNLRIRTREKQVRLLSKRNVRSDTSEPLISKCRKATDRLSLGKGKKTLPAVAFTTCATESN